MTVVKKKRSQDIIDNRKDLMRSLLSDLDGILGCKRLQDLIILGKMLFSSCQDSRLRTGGMMSLSILLLSKSHDQPETFHNMPFLPLNWIGD